MDWKTSHSYEFYPLYRRALSIVWQKRQSFSHPAERQPVQGMLGDFFVLVTAAFWLQWTVPKCKVHNPNCRGIENWKMYAVKQIDICEEYRDMVPKDPASLSGTSGLRHVVSSHVPDKPALALGTISKYSAQILICISNLYVYYFNTLIVLSKLLKCWNSKFATFTVLPWVADRPRNGWSINEGTDVTFPFRRVNPSMAISTKVDNFSSTFLCPSLILHGRLFIASFHQAFARFGFRLQQRCPDACQISERYNHYNS